MTIKLPRIIKRYVDASNEHDVKSILSEGWIVKTIEKYKFHFKPLSIKDDDAG